MLCHLIASISKWYQLRCWLHKPSANEPIPDYSFLSYHITDGYRLLGYLYQYPDPFI